jgi:hypothetical protein
MVAASILAALGRHKANQHRVLLSILASRVGRVLDEEDWKNKEVR